MNDYEELVGYNTDGSWGPIWKVNFDTQMITFEPVSFSQWKKFRRLKIVPPKDLDERDIKFGHGFARDVDRILKERNA